MPRHHHVNLGVPVGGVPAQSSFLVDVLGYRRLESPKELTDRGINVQWFAGDDGGEIHLSEDPDHRAPARAHVAVEFNAVEIDALKSRLSAAGVEFTSIDARPGLPSVLFVADPSGNRWELRAPMQSGA